MFLRSEKFYNIKKYYWILYPSKEVAGRVRSPYRDYPPDTDVNFWSRHLKVKIIFLSPGTIFTPLEVGYKYVQVISTNGDIGWIITNNLHTKHFQELKEK